jgi:hypothetical protein
MSRPVSKSEQACIADYSPSDRFCNHDYVAASTSLDQETFSKLMIAVCSRLGVDAVADLGRGKGRLSHSWREQRRPVVWLGYRDISHDSDYFYDLSRYQPQTAHDAQEFIRSKIGFQWISTCVGVAEHVDIEHLADFLFNLRSLAQSYLVLSVSTRPSSRGHRPHSTILPIDTWASLLTELGFEILEDRALASLSPMQQFTGACDELVLASHWVRANAFRDDNNHRHYLLLRQRYDSRTANLEDFRTRIALVTDTDYRTSKRNMASIVDFPQATFNVHFMQDWSFARSLMDVWPRNRAGVILRGDVVAQPFRALIESQLTKCGVPLQSIRKVGEADLSRAEDGLFITATEGQVNYLHQLNSLLMLDARRAGARTLSMQHGMVLPRMSAHVCEYVGAWDGRSLAAMRDAYGPVEGVSFDLLGSVKFLDALLPSSSAAFEARFGVWTRRFTRRCLVGLGLHWDAMNLMGGVGALDWLARAINANPDCLFLLRPHCDDGAVYARADIIAADNVILADDFLLAALDWPLARVLRQIDCVISTFSTMLIDASAAGVPCVLLPEPESGRDLLAAQLPLSSPSGAADKLHRLTLEELRSGVLPDHIFGRMFEPYSEAWFQPSLDFFANLAELLARPRSSSADIAALEEGCFKALSLTVRNHDLSVHSYPNMVRKEAALAAFLESPPPRC